MVRTRIGDNVTIVTPNIPVSERYSAVRSQRWGFRSLDFTDYVSAIEEVSGVFDLIVIDGRARQHCLPIAISRLAPGGIILFDNTNRRRYRKAIATYANGWSVERSVGLTPILPWPTETSIISRTETMPHAAAGRVTDDPATRE